MPQSKIPAATLKARNSWRAKGRADPALAAGAPEMPEWLSEDGRRFWEPLVDECLSAGVLCPYYGVALALFADVLAAYVRARDEAEGEPVASITSAGNAVTHPLWASVHKRWGMVLSMAREFGLTPKSAENVTRTVQTDPAGGGRYAVRIR